MDYSKFLQAKSQWKHECGFRAKNLPDFLFDFQKALTEWSLKKGRSAILADCGMGKSVMELVWGSQVVAKTNKPVLLLTPIAVGAQMAQEAERFGIDAKRSRDGKMTSEKTIWITNYEQLHKFDPRKFGGVICDESSGIKDFKSQRKTVVTEFLRTIKYRLLCTATAAPNDYWELGTSSEALGMLGFRDMITTFFRQETSKDDLGWGRTKYRFRGHAEEPFWAWVCSWARSLRKPSDLGFSDEGFNLPPLIEREHICQTAKLRQGMLFSMPGRDIREQREERRNSLSERCDMAADIAAKVDGSAVLWCELNSEADQLVRCIPGAAQVSGSMSDEAKEEVFSAFAAGDIDRLVLKPKIGAWGLNWQFCSNVIMFPSYSYEQYYQAVRRCYRFGQKNPVHVDIVVNEGEVGVLKSLKRKSLQSDKMFTSLVKHMHNAMELVSKDVFLEKEEVPQWLLSSK
jgi:hypothetical protein